MYSFLKQYKRLKFETSLSVLCWAAAAIPPLVTLLLVCRYRVDVPYSDDWALAERIEHFIINPFSLQNLFEQHNAHRMFFPLLILLPTAALSQWDTFYWLMLNLIFAFGTFLLLSFQISYTKKKTGDATTNLLIPAVSLIVFSQKQYINWLWGFQLIVFMSIFFVVAGIVLLSKNPFNNKNFVLAAISGIIATFSFANGILFLPLGLLVILLAPSSELKQKGIYAFWWLIIAAATCWLFFYDYSSSKEVYPSFSWHTVASFFLFVFSYLGNPLTPVNFASFSDPLFQGSHYMPFLLGITGFFVFSFTSLFLARQKRIPLQLLMPYFFFCLYALASAGMIAIGRVETYGYRGALASRYVNHGNFYWIGILALVYFAWRSMCNKTKPDVRISDEKCYRQHFFLFLFLLFAALSFVASYRSKEDLIKMHNVQEDVRMHFIGMRDDELCPPEWEPSWRYNQALKIMRKRRISIYRDKAVESIPAMKSSKGNAAAP